MPLHGARAEEKLRADLRVRATLARKLGDLGLLGGEVTERLGCSPAGLLARREELTTRALGERLHPHGDEHVVRRMQLLARVDASALTAQPLPVDEVRASLLRCEATAPESVERLAIELLGRVA